MTTPVLSSRARLQNRVDPAGQLHAVPQRGTLMGNRGILHDAAQRIKRPWAHKAWVACALAFGSTRRTLFSEGNYSELFFLDEATALAAGHRPCKTCRRDDHIRFKSAWLAANRPDVGSAFVPISDIDRQLHAERAIPGGAKRSYQAAVSLLPPGTMFQHAGLTCMVWKAGIMRWAFDGYHTAPALPSDTMVNVLTPPSIVAMLAAGYPVAVHASANLTP